MATIIIPVLLCFFLGPGVGQLYNKEYKKRRDPYCPELRGPHRDGRVVLQGSPALLAH